MSQGFTDRSGIADPGVKPGEGLDPKRKVVVEVRFIKDSERAILVADLSDRLVTAWLPRREISIETGMGQLRRITLPAWLALEKGLITEGDERQGSLL